MSVLEILSKILIGSGLVFFFAGTLGMLRFPDTYCRLHAVTKADNLGLGLVVAGLLFQAGSLWIVGKLILIWILVLMNSAASCYLIANHLFRSVARPFNPGSPVSGKVDGGDHP